ncbi:hypothetical protein TNCV_186481 [Trichonephila clavipes]|nr:hypothetical protein TNCV_186481 [Trichonephila clavipes]
MQVTERFCCILPQFLRTPYDWSGVCQLSSPSTNLTRELAARLLFRVPPCREGTFRLQISMPSPGFELMPCSTVVSGATHYTGWATFFCVKGRCAPAGKGCIPTSEKTASLLEHGGYETTPLRLKRDIEDVSIEHLVRWTIGVKDCTSWMKRSELYCSQRIRV